MSLFALDDPQTNGLLSLGLRLMSTPGNFGQALGQSGLGAMGDMQQAQQMSQARKMREMQMEQMRAQMEEQARQREVQQRTESYLQGAFSPVTGINANNASGISGPRPEALSSVGQVRGFNLPDALRSGVPAMTALDLEQRFAPKPEDFKVVGDSLVGIGRNGVREAFRAQPKPEATPASIREYQFAVGQGFKGTFEEFDRQQRATSAARTNVVVDAAPKSFWQDFGKGASDVFFKEREAAQAAAGIIGSVGSIRQAVAGGAYQGTGAELKLGAAKALGAIGMPYDQKTVANTELFNAQANKFVLDSIKQLGANPSNADRDFIEKTVPRLSTDPAALPQLLDFLESKARASVRTFNDKAKKAQQNPAAQGMPFQLEVPEPPPMQSVDDLVNKYRSR